MIVNTDGVILISSPALYAPTYRGKRDGPMTKKWGHFIYEIQSILEAHLAPALLSFKHQTKTFLFTKALIKGLLLSKLLYGLPLAWWLFLQYFFRLCFLVLPCLYWMFLLLYFNWWPGLFDNGFYFYDLLYWFHCVFASSSDLYNKFSR